jgi:hypothetical protein
MYNREGFFNYGRGGKCGRGGVGKCNGFGGAGGRGGNLICSLRWCLRTRR